MMSGLSPGVHCSPVPCGAKPLLDCGACDRGWNQGMNCSCTHPGTEDATAACIARLQSSVKIAESRPSVMAFPYLNLATDPVATATCASGVAGVGLLGSWSGGSNAQSQHRTSPLELSCVPGSGSMSVEFASFGLPVVQPAGGRYLQCATVDCADLTPGGHTGFWEAPTGVAYPITANNDCTACSALRGPGWPNSCTTVHVNASYLRGLQISTEPFSCRVQQQCIAFARISSCDAGPSVLTYVKQACDGKQSCRITLQDLPQPPPSCTASADQPMKLAVRASGCRQGAAVASFREKLASFLLTRGPHSWFGNGWIASNRPQWFDEYDVDYGEPLGQMQINDTVATRQWSKMDISLNCSSFEANFTSRPSEKHNMGI